MTSVQESLAAQMSDDKRLFNLEVEGYQHGFSDYDVLSSSELDRMKQPEREAYRKGYSEGFQDKKGRR